MDSRIIYISLFLQTKVVLVDDQQEYDRTGSGKLGEQFTLALTGRGKFLVEPVKTLIRR